MVIRMTTMVITTTSSTNVKPRRRCSAERGTEERVRAGTRLPLGIKFAIGRLLIRLAVHAEHILSAPTHGRRVVLIAAEAPIVLAGERIARDFPQQLDLLPVGTVGQLHTLHQLLETLGPTVGADLRRAEILQIAVVLVLVDRGVHFPKRGAEVALALDANAGAGQRHRHAGEDQQYGESHD